MGRNTQSGSPVITNNLITGNGTGVSCGSANPTISNNVIRGNSGDGVYAWGVSPYITNNTIVKNGGNGTYHGGSYSQNIVSNNIVAFNGIGIQGTSTSKNNCIYSNPVPAPDPNNKDYVSASAGEGDISADPKLASDYIHIQPDSPCIDAGRNQASGIYAVDVDQQQRILRVSAAEALVDIGADESTGASYNPVTRIVRVTTQGNDANDGSGWDASHAMKSVQAAVDTLAATGGEVWVAAGTYSHEHMVLTGSTRIYGGFAGSETDRSQRNWQTNVVTLDGGPDAGRRVIAICGGWDCAVDGFTIQNGRHGYYGAGIYCSKCSSVTIKNNTILNNSARSGAGIYCTSQNALIADNSITNNTSYDSSYGGSGAGIYFNSGAATITNNFINSNSATGGGPTYYGDSYGGGIYIGSTAGLVQIGYNRITNNTSNYGSGVYCASSVEMFSNWISGNSASALYAPSAVRLTGSSSQVSNNTVTVNTAGGISFTGNSSSSAIAANNVVFSNTGFGLKRGSTTPVSLYHNCVYQNGTDYSGSFDHPTDIAVNPDLASDGLHIEPYSQCVDNGEDDYVLGDFDIDGQARKTSFTTTRDAVDIGADELDTLKPTITLARSTSCTTVYATWRQYRGDVQNYYYAIGTSPTTTDVRGWTDAGGPASVDITATGFSLNHSGTYYFLLKVMQTNGQWSEVDNKQIEIGPNTLTLSANPTTAAAGSPVQITATVRDHFNNPLDMVVHFSTDSGTIDTPDPSTGSDGVVDVQVQNACQGTVTVSAYIEDTCGNRVDTSTPFTVVANVLTLSAPADTAANSTVAVTATVKDQANNPLQRLVHFSTDSGILDSEEAATGMDGTVTVHVSDACAGTTTVTAYVEDACGNQTTSTASFEVHADVLTLTCPQSSVAAGVPVTINATATNYTAAPVDRQVHFWTTGGTLDVTDGSTGSDGQITTNLTCTTGGPVVVYASMDNSYPCGGRTTKAVMLTVMADTQIVLSAAPGTGEHASQIAVTATVKDVAGNLVDRTVNFSVSSGTIDSAVQSGSDGIAEAYASYPSEGFVTVSAWTDDANGNRKVCSLDLATQDQLTLDISPANPASGAAVTVNARIIDFNGSPADREVHFSTNVGSITSVVQSGSDGLASASTTCPTSGEAMVTAYVPMPGGGYASAWIPIRGTASDVHKVGFLYYLARTGEYTNDFVDNYLERIDAHYADVTYERIGSTLADLDTYDTIFVVMPTGLTSTEIEALTDFVRIPGKRIVLAGEWVVNSSNPNDNPWAPYNARLNGLLSSVGVSTRFRTGGIGSWAVDSCYSLTRTAPIESCKLTTGVGGLWYACTSSLTGWESKGTPIAYPNYSIYDPDYHEPWIVEECVPSGGSVVCIHDTNFFQSGENYDTGYCSPYIVYDDTNDTVPNKNFKFVYNLCTLKNTNVGLLSGPDCFVPGHPNEIKYHLASDCGYGKLEIFARNSMGSATGSPIYTSTSLNLTAGDHTFTYSGTEISCDPGTYVARLTYGPDSGNTQTYEMQFDVKCWDLVWLFEDSLTDEEKAAIDQAQLDIPDDYVEEEDPLASEGPWEPTQYCAGIDASTVSSSKVTVKVWYWDQDETSASSLTIDNGVPTTDITDEDWLNVWGLDLSQKTYYDERGSAIANLNGTFYSMTNSAQCFYVKITVAEDGVMDNAGNPYDADPNTPETESSVKYKLKIGKDGNVSVLEETYE